MDSAALKAREMAYLAARPKGKYLDAFGKMINVRRKFWWTWIFKESDAKYKARLFKIAYSGAHNRC